MTPNEFDVQDQDEIADIHGFDFERVSLLLDIMQKCATIAPKATSLFGIAQAEIEILNQEAKDIALRRAKKVTEADERRRVAEQERLNTEAVAREETKAQLRPRVIPQQAAPTVQPGMPMPERNVDVDSKPDLTLGAPRSADATADIERRI